MAGVKRTKIISGDTAFNDALTLPLGYLSLDNQGNTMRVHDGVTPGGHPTALS